MKQWHTTLAAATLGCAALAITAIAAVPDATRTADPAEKAVNGRNVGKPKSRSGTHP